MKGRSTYYCSRYKRFHMFSTVSIGVLHDKWLRSLLYPMLLLERVYPCSGHLGQLQGLASVVISSPPLESRFGRGRTSKSGPCVLVGRDPVHDWKAVESCWKGREVFFLGCLRTEKPRFCMQRIQAVAENGLSTERL